MGWFIFAMFLILVSVGCAVAFVKSRHTLSKMEKSNDYGSRDEDDQRVKTMVLGIAAGVLFIIGGAIVFFDSYVIVPARNVGVVNILGNASSSLPNGFHFVQPWASVENVDTTNKPIQLNDDGDVGNGCTSIPIRLASQQIACQDVFVQWQIDPKGDANDLWKTYRGSNDDLIANIQNNVILPRLRSEMQKSFSTYDPLQVLQGGQLLDTTTLQTPVETALKGDMPNGVLILDVRFAQIHYSATTQQKIDAYSQSVADTKIAVQNEQTATAQAAANKILAQDPSSSNPGVQYQNCLNMINNLASKGQLAGLPAGFSCSQGGGTPVIVNGAK